MKKKINRNIFYIEAFLNELASLGIKYACISPGSRSTPLTYSLAVHTKIKSFVNIDERSSAFFAVGIAKATKTPVIVVTTSGTAVAETYPAIIEAFQSRIPLIICTADRPPELQNCGANQTINQKNIFFNHIRWFKDAGLPSPAKINSIRKVAQTAFEISTIKDPGPVHINFPFRKPLEEKSKTDEIDVNKIRKSGTSIQLVAQNYLSEHELNEKINFISGRIRSAEKGLIIVGPNNFTADVLERIIKLSLLVSFPVFADGCSQLRFNEKAYGKIITQYDSFLRAQIFRKNYKPDFIIHFGRTPTSTILEEFLYGLNCERFMINESGDWFDPSKQSTATWSIKPDVFCDQIIETLNASGFKRNPNSYYKQMTGFEINSAEILNKEISGSGKLSELSIINETVEKIPGGSNLFISNSLPVRDLDQFTLPRRKNINIYFNRGASGIDGIISTAAGIASVTEPKNYLVIGDLAFYHDLNSLFLLHKHKINLKIILINNSGGAIFKTLPVSQYKDIFDEYFLARHDLNFKQLVSAFGLEYRKVKSKAELSKELLKKRNKSLVIEITTDPSEALKIRTAVRTRILKHLKFS